METALFKVMRKKGIKPSDLVRMTHVRFTRISGFRTGADWPSKEQKALIAKALGVPIEEVFPAGR